MSHENVRFTYFCYEKTHLSQYFSFSRREAQKFIMRRSHEEESTVKISLFHIMIHLSVSSLCFAHRAWGRTGAHTVIL